MTLQCSQGKLTTCPWTANTAAALAAPSTLGGKSVLAAKAASTATNTADATNAPAAIALTSYAVATDGKTATTTWTTTYTNTDATKAQTKISAIRTAWNAKTADIKSAYTDDGTKYSAIWSSKAAVTFVCAAAPNTCGAVGVLAAGAALALSGAF